MSVGNYQGFSVILFKVLPRKVRIFLIPLSIAFLNPKMLSFQFSAIISLIWVSEMRKIKLQKIAGNLYR